VCPSSRKRARCALRCINLSFKAAAWAIEQTMTSTPAQKLVLIALADAHNAQTGRCDPSIQRVADICHMSYRTVSRTLVELEQLGLIARQQRVDSNRLKTSNLYVLQIGQIDPSIGHSDLTDRTNTTFPDRTQCPINQESIFNQEENLERARKRATPVPRDFVPSDDLVAWARADFPQVDIRQETSAFIDYHTAKGSTFKDHRAAWRNWVRRSVQFKPTAKRSSDKSAMYQAMRELVDEN
jgi:hypothetical protein